jgi:hypothetical protein
MEEEEETDITGMHVSMEGCMYVRMREKDRP